MATTDRAQEIKYRRDRSYDWLKNNFYPEWEQVFKHYHCHRDPVIGPDGKEDKEASNVGLPMTWAHIRRIVARGTAQIPNLKYKARNPGAGELIGRTLMYQWDKGEVQRQQKRHFTQLALCGISVRAWYWSVDTYMRSKRVNPLAPDITPETLQAIATTYGVPVQYLTHPEVGETIRARLAAKRGRGGLLSLKYPYTAYAGPKCDFLFIGDCYFEPNFQSLQSSKWFIVERRRDRSWMERIVKVYPEFSKGFQELVDKYPQGTPPLDTRQGETQSLRQRMQAGIGRVSQDTVTTQDNYNTPEWTILEQHVPGANPKLAYVGEESHFLGEIDYPYDLDGRIAFTEAILIDDLLSGIGDSTARTIRGLQQMHERQVNSRFSLVYNLERPLIGTNNRELFENPGQLKRGQGFRLVMMRGQGDMWVQGEQAAMAAVAVGLQDESGIMRLYQMATGDSNMSLAANVDPSQNRTATGARIMQNNQDVLTKDVIDSFNATSVQADAQMMFLLNRSEFSDALEFDASLYNRDYASGKDLLKEEWVKIEPELFQLDGEIIAEVGSTLADDDEANVAKATNLFQAAIANPNVFNIEKARDEFLIAMGKGRELAQWAAPPQPDQPQEMKAALSVALKWEMLDPVVQQQILLRAGIIQAPQGPPPPGPAAPGMMPEGAPGMPQAGASPSPPPGAAQVPPPGAPIGAAPGAPPGAMGGLQ